MSLTSATDSSAKIILRTADQYHLWKARVHAACWAATRLRVFDLKDQDCIALMDNFKPKGKGGDESKIGEKADGPYSRDVIGKAWSIVTQSLHDELFIKLIHVEQGLIGSLMEEIRSALLINISEDIQPLRLEIYAASMQRDCNNDLQTFIAYIVQRRDKLRFLKADVPDSELVFVFLKGLPSIFQPLQVHYAIPGNDVKDFDSLLVTVRKFAGTPIVASELAKLKSAGISQNVFTATSRATPNNKDKAYCFRFSKTGSCSFGDKCKFYHANVSNGSATPGHNTPGPRQASPSQRRMRLLP